MLFVTVSCAEGTVDAPIDDVRPEPERDASMPRLDAGESADTGDLDSGRDTGCVPAAELCNGLDDDCDGVVDNVPTDAGRACTAGTGACETTGEIACVDGELVCDAVANAPTAEFCGNDVDDDCDGEIDEGFPNLGDSCTIGEGACSSNGTVVCSQDQLVAVCDAPVIDPSPELCGNQLDDDCDGEVDEDFAIGTPCSVGEGACRADGVTICSASGESTVCDAVAAAPGDELCGNGIDDDCDGQTDEDFALAGMACSVGTGACAAVGIYECSADLLDIVCNASAGPPTAELCGNNIDDNCDGQVDEGFGDLGTACTVSLNTCSAIGTVVCDGTTTICDAVVTPTAETCDGTDEDCNGDIDDDPVCGACADDPFEVNDFASSAAPLPADTRHDLVSCFTDIDWFDLGIVAAGETIVVNATFEDLRADLDLSLVGPSGTTVAASTTSTDDEQIVFTVTTSGTYLLQVRQFGPKAVQDYTLFHTTLPAPPACANDAWEDNDTADSAPDLPLQRTITAEICPQDSDWYNLGTVTPGFGVRVTLTHAASSGNIDMRLLRYGSEVAATTGGSDTKTLVYWPEFGGNLDLVVEGAGSTVANDYTLIASFAGAFACEPTGTDVAAEPDDTPATAVSLSANDGRDAAICGTLDWVRMPSIQAGDDIAASLFFTNDVGDLDLWIFPDLGTAGPYDATTAIVNGVSTTDDEHVRFVAPVGGDYLARIEGFGGDLGRYRFVWDAVSYTCDDPFEPNNRFASFPSLAYQTSTRLQPDTTYDATLCAADLDNFELGAFGVGQTIEVTVTGDVGDFEVELYDGLTSVASDAGTNIVKTLTFVTTDDDDHTLAVRPLNGANVAYTVSYQVL
jgi:hypothetical protein